MSTQAIATAKEVFDLLRDDLSAIETELVRDAVGAPFRALLDEPRQTMTGVHAAFRASTTSSEAWREER